MKRALTIITLTLLSFSCTLEKGTSKIPLNITTKYTNTKGTHTESKKTAENEDSKSTKKASNTNEQEVVDIKDIESSQKQVLISNTISQKTRKFKAKFVKLSVNNMPLRDFLILVFNKILGANYAFDPSVERLIEGKTITLQMKEKLPIDKFLPFLTDLLKGYNLQLEFKDGIFKISSLLGGRNKNQEKPTVILFGKNPPKNLPPGQVITQIIPLKYINSSTYLPILRQLLASATAKVVSLPDTNTIAVTSTVSDVKILLNLINLFDRPYFKSREIKLIYLDFISPKEFVKKISTILQKIGIPTNKPDDKASLVVEPIDTISAVLVISPDKEWTKQVLTWKEKLDCPEALGEEEKLFVYRPQNRDAKELAEILKKLAKENQQPLSSKREKTTQSAKITTAEKFKVILDKERNQLLIYAKPREYYQLKKILKKLDILPKQVLVEVTIAEVTLKDSLQYGVEWYLKHSGKINGELYTLGGLGVGGSGLVYSFITSTQKFQALLNAFAQKNLIKILSTPRLVVLDNHDATINVGTQVPVVTSEVTSADIQNTESGPSILRNVTYRTTGVILNIKPVVHSNGILTLDIQQEVSEAQTNNISNIDSPLILNRSIKTSVVLKSGQTAVLGGLISENHSRNTNKVPLLGDLPIVGDAFKSTSVSDNKTELIVIITPYIINTTSEMQEITQELEKGFSNIFIDSNSSR